MNTKKLKRRWKNFWNVPPYKISGENKKWTFGQKLDLVAIIITYLSALLAPSLFILLKDKPIERMFLSILGGLAAGRSLAYAMDGLTGRSARFAHTLGKLERDKELAPQFDKLTEELLSAHAKLRRAGLLDKKEEKEIKTSQSKTFKTFLTKNTP